MTGLVIQGERLTFATFAKTKPFTHLFGRYNKNADSSRCCPNEPIHNAASASGNSATCNFVCNPGFQWSNATLSCISCPSISTNSTFTRGCESVCKHGYAGNPCISCLDHIGSTVLPPGGAWNMTTCGLSCLSGFKLFSSTYCCPTQIPQNALVANEPMQCNLKCNEGYRWNSSSLSCSSCPGYIQKTMNNTIWGSDCDFVCKSDSAVPPGWPHFECLTCPECQTRCLPPSYPSPSDLDVVWTFNSGLSGSSKCQWSCPASRPQLSGTRCCSRPPSPAVAYVFKASGSCEYKCSPGYDALTDPRGSLFRLQCVPCSMSYRAPLVPLNAFWSDTSPQSGDDTCNYFCKSGFTMFNSNGTDLCCKLPQYAALKSGAQTCNDWVCPSNTYKLNEGCFNTSVMSTVCAKHYYCSHCLAAPGCGWCDSSQSCLPGTAEGTITSNICAKWKFGSCADDCVGRSCETCTNFASSVPGSTAKCSWCSSTSECIRSQTAAKSCSTVSTFNSLETCITPCSALSDCSSCVSTAGCLFCSGKSACLSNPQYSYLIDDPRRYNYFCDKVYGKNLPGSCPSFADNMYLILIVALGSISCACFLWFLCSRTRFFRTLCECCNLNRNVDLDNDFNAWGDHELGVMNQHNGSGLDPNVLQEFPLIKYQQQSSPNIKFQEDGFVLKLSIQQTCFNVILSPSGPPRLAPFVLEILKLETLSVFCRVRTHFIRAAS